MRRLALLTALAAAMAAGSALAQAPKIAEGRDITGAWDRFPPGASSRNDRAVPAPPLKPEHLAAWQTRNKAIQDAEDRGEPLALGYAHCLPDGMPAMMMGMFPMEVLQTKGQITIVQEAYNQVRRIYLNDKLPPIEDAEPRFWGHSVGKWEGDTLVVETVGIKENVRFKEVPHSAEMKIVERMKVTGPDTFENQVTVNDPEYLTTPWTWTWGYKRRPAYKMNEYVCEDNREYADPETGQQRLRLLPGTARQ